MWTDGLQLWGDKKKKKIKFQQNNLLRKITNAS